MSKIFVFLRYRKNFSGTQKRVRIYNGKRAIGVRAIKIRLFLLTSSFIYSLSHSYVFLQKTGTPSYPLCLGLDKMFRDSMQIVKLPFSSDSLIIMVIQTKSQRQTESGLESGWT